ncbi:hypothetical protein P7C70_g6206, partial [Phenoliferia sp. Uapishka_3]
MDPDFDFKKLDIVTDRNNLRKLLRWAAGVSDKDVRIDVDQVGNTLLFTRWETKSTDTAGNGFGHTFELGMTRVATSCLGHQVTGHHRIVSFDFEGICMLVRFEVDACSADVASANDSKSSDIADLLSGLDIKDKPRKHDHTVAGIKIIPSGTLIPQSSIVELKTRSMQSPFDTKDAYSQLFFSQTPTLILGRHTRGTFTSVDSMPLAGMVLEQQAAQAGLAKVAAALKNISSVISRAKGEKFAIKIIGGEMKLYKRLEGDALSKELKKEFE